MDPLVIGALIQGASSLLGGALNRRGVGKTTADEMRAKILTGQEFGLHPLAAIGAQTSGYSGHYIGDGVADAGAALGQAISAKGERDRSRSLEKAELDLVQAQTEEVRSRTRINEMNARPAAPIDPYAMRQVNSLIAVKLENGDIVYIPNPDVYENSPTELVTGRGIIEGARAVQGGDGNSVTLSFPDSRPVNRTTGDIRRMRKPWEH